MQNHHEHEEPVSEEPDGARRCGRRLCACHGSVASLRLHVPRGTEKTKPAEKIRARNCAMGVLSKKKLGPHSHTQAEDTCMGPVRRTSGAKKT